MIFSYGHLKTVLTIIGSTKQGFKYRIKNAPNQKDLDSKMSPLPQSVARFERHLPSGQKTKKPGHVSE